MSADNVNPVKPVFMTKLMQWLLGASIFFAIWGSVVTKQLIIPVGEEWMNLIMLSPIIAVLIFGLYAGVVVLWRVYNFNNCEDAAQELLEQIKEARADLITKGMTFKQTST